MYFTFLVQYTIFFLENKAFAVPSALLFFARWGIMMESKRTMKGAPHMRVKARAKINWTLDILGRREDGYHLMDMLMQPVTLCDDLELQAGAEITLRITGSGIIPADRRNLAWRAAEALQAATGYAGGAAIHVHKRIPSGAGLGGGSADAAGVLWGLNRLWGTGLTLAELERIGLNLGADVPFCLRGGLARVGGIGEEVRSLPGAPAWPLVIVQPCRGLSTRTVFAAYHAAECVQRPDTDGAEHALLSGNLPALPPCLGNALEGVSLARRPAIGEAIDALLSLGAAGARMSGSGSAVFGVFADDEAARCATNELKARWKRTYLCRSCRESLMLAER